MKTIYYNNYRLICLIFMWCCVIPLYSTENMYYVYRVNTTQSYDFATNLNEIAPNAEILVEEGATLIVDNATIVNAEIIVQDGGSLIIRNSGIIQQGEDDKVDIQLGGTLEIESGEIRISE